MHIRLAAFLAANKENQTMKPIYAHFIGWKMPEWPVISSAISNTENCAMMLHLKLLRFISELQITGRAFGWEGDICSRHSFLLMQGPLWFWEVFDINIMHHFHVVLNFVCGPVICSDGTKILNVQRCWPNVQAPLPPCPVGACKDNRNNWPAGLQSQMDKALQSQ